MNPIYIAVAVLLAISQLALALPLQQSEEGVVPNEPVIISGDQPGGADVKDTFHYDLVYDESVCNGELKNDAVENYILVGTEIKSFQTAAAVECKRACFEMAECKSANFYRGYSPDELGTCELNSNTQIANPRWMTKYWGAVYMENIRCEAAVTDNDQDNTVTTKAKSPEKTKVTKDPEQMMFGNAFFQKLLNQLRQRTH